MQLVRESAPSGEPLPKKSQGDTTSSAGLRSAITWQCCWRCCSPWLAPRVCSQPQNTLGVRLNEEFPVETVLPAISDPIILPAAQLCLSPFFYPSLTHPSHQASIPHPSQPAPLPAFIHPSMSPVIPLGLLPSLNPSSQAPSTLPDPNPTTVLPKTSQTTTLPCLTISPQEEKRVNKKKPKIPLNLQACVPPKVTQRSPLPGHPKMGARGGRGTWQLRSFWEEVSPSCTMEQCHSRGHLLHQGETGAACTVLAHPRPGSILGRTQPSKHGGLQSGSGFRAWGMALKISRSPHGSV